VDAEPSLDPENVRAIIGGLFEMNAKLGDISDDVAAIRALLEEEDDGEEAEDD
jgi:hypothetical protein